MRALLVWVIDTDRADADRRGCLAINASMETAGRTGPVAETTRRHFARLEDALLDVAEGALAALG